MKKLIYAGVLYIGTLALATNIFSAQFTAESNDGFFEYGTSHGQPALKFGAQGTHLVMVRLQNAHFWKEALEMCAHFAPTERWSLPTTEQAVFGTTNFIKATRFARGGDYFMIWFQTRSLDVNIELIDTYSDLIWMMPAGKGVEKYLNLPKTIAKHEKHLQDVSIDAADRELTARDLSIYREGFPVYCVSGDFLQ